MDAKLSNQVYNDPERRRKAKRLLREWLPRIRAAVRRGEYKGLEAEKQSGVAEQQKPFVVPDNIDGVFIYQTAPKAWFFDITLKHVPIGIPGVLGTPVSMPHETREQAEAFAKFMLAVAVHQEENPPDETADAVFVFHGFEYKVPRAVLAEVRAEGERMNDLRTPEQVHARLDELTAELFPNGVSEAAMDALPHEKRTLLAAACCTGLIVGVFRHPRRALNDDVLDENSSLSKIH